MLDQSAVAIPSAAVRPVPATVPAPVTTPGQAPVTSPAVAVAPPRIRLSEEQRRVVEHPVAGGHLLVRAGPGSGKTETIRARIAALVTRHDVAPEAILALTFSRRAALSLTQRIQPSDVWSGTFHAAGVDILERWGASIGITHPLHIFDEERQKDALRQGIARAGFTRYLDDRQQKKFTDELKNRISRRKRRGHDEPDHQTGDDRIPDEVVARVHEAYRAVLAEAGALDFDDLISRAIAVLHADDHAAAHYQRRLRFVFIDEFHDISPEQFELVRLLAPARSGVQVVAIADPDQAIYDWRGADVEAMLHAYRREYRPREYRLLQNFRSTPEIIAAANAVIGTNRTSPPTSALDQGNPERRLPVDVVEFPNEEVEVEKLAQYIERAVTSGYTYGDIAILSRTHGRSAMAAALLPQHNLPIARVEPGRFFSQQAVQEGLRYLELLLALRDDHFVPALNWPRVLVDEVTMVHLRRLARREAITLCDLASRIDEFAHEVSPLTRAAVRDFFRTVADPLGDLVEQPVSHLIEPFLDVLRRRRSPVPPAHRANLRDTLDLLGRRLAGAAAALASAVANGQPVAVRAARDDGDSAAAIVILAHTLHWYFDRDLLITGPGADPPTPAFVIDLGQERPATSTGCGLSVWETPHLTFNLGTQAWRLGQLLLMQHETEPDLPLVTFDLETGDRHPITAEIIEIGAERLGGEADRDRIFARLVRPSGPGAITRGASRINGLTWEMVASQPAVAEVLPGLLAFLDDAVLVGHNIEDFDYPILRRTVRDHGGPVVPPLRHLLIDTFKMAKRVLPGQRSHRLEDLARSVDPGVRQEHRVAHDLGLTGQVFAHLRQQHRQQLELDTLTEALPVVALSLLASGVAITHDNALLAEIGSRAAAFGQGATLLAAWRARVDPALAQAGAAWLATDRPEATAPESAADDQAWATMEAHWRSALEMYSRHGGDPSLAGFLRYAALAEAIDVVPLSDEPGAGAAVDDDPRRLGRKDRIAMMTVHSAKGLEWPLVFLLGVEDDQFPHYRSHSPNQQAEERRLLYVGMSRARQRLCLLWSRSSGGRDRDLSSFLAEVPGDIITRRNPPTP